MSTYDKMDPSSIEAYGRRLIGKTLRFFLDDKSIGLLSKATTAKAKGHFGQVLEEFYFGITPGNAKTPDFNQAGVELKTSPLKKIGTGLSSKERLVLNIINYNEMATESWESSTFRYKNALLLLVFYLHEDNKPFIDYLINLVSLWDFPQEDLEIIKRDWNAIKLKIEQGKAHEISEGDTYYLGACTKGKDKNSLRGQPNSGIMAKQRALALKASYINAIFKALTQKEKQINEVDSIVKDADEIKSANSFDEIVVNRFQPYLNKSIDEIHKSLKIDLKPKSKAYYDGITRAILGVRKKKIEEFEKADVVLRTIRLNSKNTPEEDISFPAFDYKNLVDEKWEESNLKTLLEKRFFLVVYKYEGDKLVLKKVMFWVMPYHDLETHVKKVWKETVKRIKQDKCDDLPKKSEYSVAHVRPHGRNSQDTILTPSGKLCVKKSFWLNAQYIKEQILLSGGID